MSGILKRKLEEGPSPYLSLQGSEDDVSCSDSGNSSDSLNHPVPSGLLDSSSLQQQSKRLRGCSVHFESVTVYYFTRRQGFTTVPTQGGSTLGMSPRHSWVKRFTLREFAMEQKRSHHTMLKDHLKEEKLNAIKLKLTKNGTMASVEADTLTLDDISVDDLDVDNTEVDDYFFLQPLTTRRRRALLRASGVRRIDVEEKHELRALRMSREECGCRCRGICDPETCACSLAGIKCQVDRMSFPCGCTKEGCSNTTGRLEFNPVRVRTHFLHTIMKLELEKSGDQQQQQQLLPQHQQPEQQLVTNGNSYHGDSSLVQQQPNLQFPLMSGAAHIPIMHLQSTGDTDSQLDEEEEEDEEDDDDDDDEEEDDEEEEDEAYEDDEDEEGSSMCSGVSDCSTHSLETIDTDDGEEDEGDEDEGDEEEDDDDEEEEDWECSVHGATPSSYTVPLPSVLSYSNNTLMSLDSPFDSGPSMQHYQIDSSAFLCENVAVASAVEPALEFKIPSKPQNTELCCHKEQQSITCHFPNTTEPLTSQTCPCAPPRESNIAPISQSDKLQFRNNLADSQTEQQKKKEPEQCSLELAVTEQETDASCSESKVK
ncbi:cysteine/serine-rich nuclear protein 3-like isoform X1 [Thalassophryne amazonica]|uniref:cysteine/serine-rich nuclear protein 3-like isoform X1 n=1 Tax=Thalassophryne amazonica TaxID=390379 RepID=UPI001471E194|nr:cysteine/serine-rich nuclear protein 3-like isoform X1 [Thalassophryne amazonica]